MSLVDNNKRILKNTLALYVRMVLMMVINLYTSRVVLSALGIDDFGLYGIVAGLSGMLGFISNSLATATSRYLSYNLGSENQEGQINKIFQTSLSLHLLLSFLIFIIGEAISEWMLTDLVVIPESRLYAARWVYHISMVIACLAIVIIPYNALIISHERMNFYALITIVDGGIKLIISFIIDYAPFDRLIFYSCLLLTLQVFILLFYMFFSYTKIKNIYWGVSLDKSLFRQLLSFSGWNFLSQIASISTNQGISILLNNFFGLTINAAKDITFQVQQAVAKTCINFQIAVNPQITKSYASHEMSYMHSLIIASSKFSSYLLYIFAIPVFLEVSEILDLWLVEVPLHSDNFVRIMLLQALLGILSNPISVGIYATGRMKNYSLTISSFSLLVLPLSYWALKYEAIPEYVFTIYLIIEVFTFSLKLKFMKKYLNLTYKCYFKNVVLYIFSIAVLSFILCFILHYFVSLNIFIRLPLMALIVLMCICLFGLSSLEKSYAINFLKKYVKL